MLKIELIFYICSPQKRAISSVGSEHYVDNVGVVGSNPILPTFLHRTIIVLVFIIIYFFFSKLKDTYFSSEISL
jgi:hypothetical protein